MRSGAERRLDQPGDRPALGLALDLRHHRADHLAHVLGPRGAGLRHGRIHDLDERCFREHGGKEALGDRDLRFFGRVQLGVADLRVGLDGLAALLHVALEDLDLLVAAERRVFRLRRLRLHERRLEHAHRGQRRGVLLLHGADHLRLDAFADRRFRHELLGAWVLPCGSPERRTLARGYPPLTAGTMWISAPSGTAVASPPVKRMLSYPTNSCTCSRTSPVSVSTRSRTPGTTRHSASSASDTLSKRPGSLTVARDPGRSRRIAGRRTRTGIALPRARQDRK